MYKNKALGIYFPAVVTDDKHYHEYKDEKCKCGKKL